jgi:hypothetical protein
MFNQCEICIRIQYPTLFTEVLFLDVASTEAAIEGSISTLLMELFGGPILVDDVTVQLSQPNPPDDDSSDYYF